MEHWRSGYLSASGSLTENVGSGAVYIFTVALKNVPCADLEILFMASEQDYGPYTTVLFNISYDFNPTWYPVLVRYIVVVKIIKYILI